MKNARLSFPPEQLEESHASLQETLILVYKNQGNKRNCKVNEHQLLMKVNGLIKGVNSLCMER